MTVVMPSEPSEPTEPTEPTATVALAGPAGPAAAVAPAGPEAAAAEPCCPTCERWVAAGQPMFTAGAPLLAITAAEAVVLVELDGRPPVWLRPQGDTVTFGRALACDVCTDDLRWTRRQSQLRFADGVVYACDLDSACGTFIDDAQLRADTPLPVGGAMTFAGARVTVVRAVPDGVAPYRR